MNGEERAERRLEERRRQAQAMAITYKPLQTMGHEELIATATFLDLRTEEVRDELNVRLATEELRRDLEARDEALDA